MSGLFAKIALGEIPCHKIAENERCLAFLDINPLAEGHTLVIPKQEIDYFFDIEDGLLSELMIFSKKVSIAIKKAIPCKRIGVSIIGLEIPHAHIHLIPMNSVSDMNFSKGKLKFTEAELTETAEKIRSYFN